VIAGKTAERPLSVRYGTFAGTHGNGREAPTAVIGATTIENARWIFLSLDYLVGTPR
jgi:hypothetical protein